MVKRFHSHNKGKRRGDCLPARLRFVARRGVTLVELLVAMLILTIVCTAWLEIIGIQSARKEARRREAVERLAGMMDAFMYEQKNIANVSAGGYYMVDNGNGRISFQKTSQVMPVFEEDVSPIGYHLRVVTSADPLVNDTLAAWGTAWGGKNWLVGLLYDRTDVETNPGNEFFKLPVRLW